MLLASYKDAWDKETIKIRIPVFVYDFLFLCKKKEGIGECCFLPALIDSLKKTMHLLVKKEIYQRECIK